MRAEANLLGNQLIGALAIESTRFVGRRSLIGSLWRIRCRRAHERRLARAARGVAGLATCETNKGHTKEQGSPQGIRRKSSHQRASAGAAIRRSLRRVTTKDTPIPTK